MKKKLTNLSVLCAVAVCVWFLPNFTLAQQRLAVDVQEWPKSKVVLTSGETLYGVLTYYRTQEILNVQNENGDLVSLSPVNVDYFVVQEMPSGRSSIFKTLAWNLGRGHSNFKKPTFFEELNSGALSLLLRESYINRDGANLSSFNRSYMSSNLYDSGDWTQQIKELYYVLLPDGDIVPLRNVRKDLHTLFGSKSREVKSYVKQNKLDYEKPHELIAIINYFNSLTSSTSHAF